MEIPQLDRSNYLKGLLITARKDKQLNETEVSVLKKLALKLGFSSDFFNETISNLLDNKYITEDPLKFSNSKIARSFIEDGLKLAFSDNRVTDNEIKWLKETASENKLDEIWFNKKMKDIQSKIQLSAKLDFALYSLI